MTALLLLCALAAAADVPSSTVGLPGRLRDLVLPGTELEARPADRRAPVVLRVVRAYPHGTAFRYDLEYVGLDPGTFDLRDYLQRKDRSPTANLPPIRVRIDSVLPPGQVLPHDLEPRGSPRLGGYRLTLTVAATVWVVGLASILLLGRRRRRHAAASAPTLTLADRLKPLVEGAIAGKGDPVQLAELERTLIVYWTRRLQLNGSRPAHLLTEQRRHPEAGPLLAQLELWLHRPGPSGKIDVAALLEPYRRLPSDSLEAQARP